MSDDAPRRAHADGEVLDLAAHPGTGRRPPPPRAALPPWARRLVGALLTLVVLSVVLVIALPLLAGPVVGLVAGAVDVEPRAANIDDLPILAERSVVLDADGGPLAVLHDEVDRRVVPLDDVPQHVRDAVLIAEDRRFFEHDGYDGRAIARALLANLRAGHVEEGASTISQQVAQQAFLGREQTLSRKMDEISYAVALEERLSKEEILERYLNEVYFGSGAYGIAAASEQFFRAQPSELTVDQAALLAGLIRAPEALSPRDEPDLARARRDQILGGMAEEGLLDAEEATRLQGEAIEVAPPLEREVAAPYALEAVKREFSGLEAFGDDAEERFAALFSGGLVVHTTLDRRLQEFADGLVSEAFPDPAGPTAAVVSLDPRSGAIRALHGGVDFEETQFDLATQGRRQPGSALKPFVAAAALGRGLSANAAFEGDGPLAFVLDDADQPWSVDNFGGARLGTVDLARATTSSVNTAFAQLMLTVGVEETVAAAETLGIDAEAAFGPPESWGPSIVLGGLTHGVTPLEMAAAFGAFADQGRLGPPFIIERVEDTAGQVVYERESTDRRHVLDAGANATMVDLLTGVVTSGTGTAAQLDGWDVLGKTGTTDNSSDAWFVGATATLSTAVWVGHPEEQVEMPGMTGGSVPAELWHAFVSEAVAGVDPVPFPDADAPRDVPAPDSVTVPDVSGMPVGAALVELADEGLTGVIADGDGADPSRAVLMQEPNPGGTLATGEAVVLRFTDPRPPPAPEDDGDDDEDDEDEDEDDEDEDDEDD